MPRTRVDPLSAEDRPVRGCAGHRSLSERPRLQEPHVLAVVFKSIPNLSESLKWGFFYTIK